MAAQQRPLSPHLQVYKPQLTSILSIVHRGTGVLLGLAAFGLMAWLLSTAGSIEAFDRFHAFVGSAPGQVLLAAVTASMVYHLLNGIRHLLWDIGWGFELSEAYASGWIVVGLTVVITSALVFVAMNAGGAA
ncbi:MAG: succinate dehydrogenase, cytochrome b556 subunit [Arenimonas sp.]|jgi:succinate dehydrogenase / fumarate reductase cytochrome b subunit